LRPTLLIIVFCLSHFCKCRSDKCRPSVNGKLHVQGTDLFDEQGNQVVIKGASTHGLTLSKKMYTLQVTGTVVAIRNSCNPTAPCVYTVEILDFGGQKDEYIQMLYDRTTTLPQRLQLSNGLVDNLWNNIGQRIVTR
jgi:cellulose synthase (UDP-forming)